MALPSGGISLANLDAGTDSAASARADLHNAVDQLNDLIAAIRPRYLNAGAYLSATYDRITAGGGHYGLDVKPGGGVFFYYARSTGRVYSYEFDTPWIMSTSVTTTTTNYDTGSLLHKNLKFSPDGTKFYLMSDSEIKPFTMSTAWNLTTATGGTAHDFTTHFTTPLGYDFASDGLSLYVHEGTGKKIYKFALTSAWDVSTISASPTQSSNIETLTGVSGFTGLRLSATEDKIYLVSNSSTTVCCVDFGTAGDVSTLSYNDELIDVGFVSAKPKDILLNPDNHFLYVQDEDGDVFTFHLSDDVKIT